MTNEEKDDFDIEIKEENDFLQDHSYEKMFMVEVLEVEGLTDRLLLGSSNPFILLKIEKEGFKTKTVKGSTCPRFYQKFYFQNASKNSVLNLSVRDNIKIGSKSLGKLDLPLDNYFDGKEHDEWFEIKSGSILKNVLKDVNPFNKGKSQGRIHLRLCYSPKPKDHSFKKLVVLVLENHSFDNLFGALPGVNGIKGKEKKYAQEGVQPEMKAEPITIIDPGHTIQNMKEQLSGKWITNAKHQAEEQLKSKLWPNGKIPKKVLEVEGEKVMHYFDPDNIPVITTLAQEFCVFDSWHSAFPGPTFPNRWFISSGTSSGHTNNFAFCGAKTVFNQFKDWKIYYHDIALSILTSSVMMEDFVKKNTIDNISPMAQFYKDAKNGTLPAYSYIEPVYFTAGEHIANDMHPPHNVLDGEQLILDVYDALCSNEKQFEETVFLIIFDENGGFFDHVDPPLVQGVSGKVSDINDGVFKTYGLRVPALAINPLISKRVENRLFEHCSVPSTIIKLFNLPDFLNERVYNANTFENICDLKKARTLKEMPDPKDLQKKLNALKSFKFTNEMIPQEIIDKTLTHPHGIEALGWMYGVLKFTFKKTLNIPDLKDFEGTSEKKQGEIVTSVFQQIRTSRHENDTILKMNQSMMNLSEFKSGKVKDEEKITKSVNVVSEVLKTKENMDEAEVYLDLMKESIQKMEEEIAKLTEKKNEYQKQYDILSQEYKNHKSN